MNTLWVIICSSGINTPDVLLFTVVNFSTEQVSLQDITRSFRTRRLEFNNMTRVVFQSRGTEEILTLTKTLLRLIKTWLTKL